MGKRNPFSYKPKSHKSLLLLTELSGKIVHSIGNPQLLNSTYHQLFLKNFLKDFLTPESREALFQEIQSQEVLPLWMNQRIFKGTINTTGKRGKKSSTGQKFSIKFYRLFVKFTSEFNPDIPCQTTIKSKEDFQKLRAQQQLQQVILVFLQPVPLQPIVPEAFQSRSQKNSCSNRVQEVIVISSTPQMKQSVFLTPIKKSRALDRSTGKNPDSMS